MKKTVPVLFAVAAAALGAGAFVYRGAPAGAPDDGAPPIVPPVTRSAAPDKPLTSATIYRVITDNDGSRLQPVRAPLPAGGDPKIAALNAMAKLGADSPLPPGARCLSVTMHGDGVAFADFNGAFRSNFPGGDEAEALAVNAVLATLAQFHGVERVQILVEGKKIDSLGGTQSLTEPLPVPTGPADSEAGR